MKLAVCEDLLQDHDNQNGQQLTADERDILERGVKPFRPSSAISLMYVALVPYSPPTESPWNKRASNKRAGAQVPIASYPGRQAMIREPNTSCRPRSAWRFYARDGLRYGQITSHQSVALRILLQIHLPFAVAALWCFLTGRKYVRSKVNRMSRRKSRTIQPGYRMRH